MQYGYTKKVAMAFDDAVAHTREALSKEGFGVLTEINVKETLKKKLNVEFDKYIILGACNPPFAYKALQAEHEIGLLLPCNVVVYEKDGVAFVSAILPSVAMQMVENDELKEVAIAVEEKLKVVVNNLV